MNQQFLNKTSDYLTFQILDNTSAGGFADQDTKEIDLIKPKFLIGINFFTYYIPSGSVRAIPEYSEVLINISDPLPYGKPIELQGGTGTLLSEQKIRIFNNTNFDFVPVAITKFNLEFQF